MQPSYAELIATLDDLLEALDAGPPLCWNDIEGEDHCVYCGALASPNQDKNPHKDDCAWFNLAEAVLKMKVPRTPICPKGHVYIPAR